MPERGWTVASRESLRERLLFELCAFATAVQTFTRVPVPAVVGWSAAQARAAVRYWPWLGLCVGGVAALVFLLTRQVVAHSVAVLCSMGATLWLTGAMHEDGLADTADGLGGGGTDRARVLAILQDPRLGSFGVIALVMALMMKHQLLVTLPPHAFLGVSMASHVLSRSSALWVMVCLRYVRDDGPSKSRPMAAQRLSWQAFGVGALAALPGCWALGVRPMMVLAAVATAALSALAVVGVLRRRLGGYVGDTLGAAQQCTELAVLAVCAVGFGSVSNG